METYSLVWKEVKGRGLQRLLDAGLAGAGEEREKQWRVMEGRGLQRIFHTGLTGAGEERDKQWRVMEGRGLQRIFHAGLAGAGHRGLQFGGMEGLELRVRICGEGWAFVGRVEMEGRGCGLGWLL